MMSACGDTKFKSKLGEFSLDKGFSFLAQRLNGDVAGGSGRLHQDGT